MTKSTLLTFLGRAPKGEGTYRTTSYVFPDGFRSDPVAFLGWPLRKRLASDKLVIMGTAGSMWDHLFEGDLAFGESEVEARSLLIDCVEKGTVTPDTLLPLQPLLSHRLGCDVRLALIPYCRNEREQVSVLRVMAAHVDAGDAVDIDVTHGFRHLPMIALLAALYLRVARRAEIRGIWYGAFDPDTGEAPVHDLVGLLRIADWLQALHTYDKDGDYSVFSSLIGMPGELLQRAAFFERSSNAFKARESLSSWAGRADRLPADDPAAELFRSELENRVSWFRKQDRSSWECELAWRYLDQGDYVRAAIFGLESAISAAAGNSGKHDERNAAKDELMKSGPEAVRTLNAVRNALAHGSQPSAAVQKLLDSEAGLRSRLEELFVELLGARPA